MTATKDKKNKYQVRNPGESLADIKILGAFIYKIKWKMYVEPLDSIECLKMVFLISLKIVTITEDTKNDLF